MSSRATSARYLALPLTRVGFVVVCGYFAWELFDGRWSEIKDALERMSWWVAVSLVLTLAGLLVTSQLWSRILELYGHGLPWRRAASVFFAGQIGKYVPGSVWSIGAQARLTRVTRTPAASVVGTGLLFLAVHVASGLFLGGLVLALVETTDVPIPRWGAAAVAVVGAAVFHPRVLGRLSLTLSGLRLRAAIGWAESGRLAVSMVVVWCFYTAALVVLMERVTWAGTAVLLASVTLSYAVGVLVVVAPAGLGAREAAFVTLTSPVLGLTEAAALALVGRLVHTVADFVLAAAGVGTLRVQDEQSVAAPDTL